MVLCLRYGAFAGAFTSFLPLLVVVPVVWMGADHSFCQHDQCDELHIMKLDEQAIVILASVGALLVAKTGLDVMSDRGLVTMLAIMSLTS